MQYFKPSLPLMIFRIRSSQYRSFRNCV